MFKQRHLFDQDDLDLEMRLSAVDADLRAIRESFAKRGDKELVRIVQLVQVNFRIVLEREGFDVARQRIEEG